MERPGGTRGAFIALWVSAALLLMSCAAQPSETSDDPSVARWSAAMTEVPVYPRLEPFASVVEFETYLRDIRRVAKRHQLWWASNHTAPKQRVLLAQNTSDTPCDPTTDDCDAELNEVVTTARKATTKSITNNQVAGVDEGDIVKNYGRFLIVLHHGRLFSIDTRSRPGELQLVDRVNAYQDNDSGAWYDEMLIHEHQLLVTGYSYQEERSEISIFDLDEQGHFTLASRFFIQSDDYFSFSNYATRLVDGQLVLYTPIDLTELDDGKRVTMPRIRRWTPTTGLSEWQNLFELTDIYRPITPTVWPFVHTISVCPLRPAKKLACRSRGVVGSPGREMYVSPAAVYLWIQDDQLRDYEWQALPDCEGAAEARTFEPLGATLFQMPFGQAPLRAVRATGRPPDQFALEERERYFYALVRRIAARCELDGPQPLDLIRIEKGAWSDEPRPVPARYYQALPPLDDGALSTRFAPTYLAYGLAEGWWHAYYSSVNGKVARDASVIVVTLERGRSARRLPLVHTVERLELLGHHAVAFGIDSVGALGLSTIDLGATPHVADHRSMPGALESEGRSHAFNANVTDDGLGLFGLPIAIRTGTKKGWYDDYSNHVAFFGTDTLLKLTPADKLSASDAPDDPSYACEVSCYDWYGNSRPIFFRDRIFALIGRELVEGRLSGSRVVEVARVNLTVPPR